MSSSNPAATERVALITGTRWCQCCSRWANAATGALRTMRSRHRNPVKRWVCGTCTAKREASKALAKAAGACDLAPSVSRQDPVATTLASTATEPL